MHRKIHKNSNQDSNFPIFILLDALIMETVNKIEYKVRDLNTRSVILFPTRAQVSRDITSVNLKVSSTFHT